MPKLMCLWIWEACGHGTNDAKTQGKESRSRARSRRALVAASAGDEAEGEVSNVVPRPKGQSFSLAQKMRAAISWYYSHVQLRGNVEWREDENGQCTGNPSYSPLVSNLMKGLQRQKVRFNNFHR